MTDWSEERWVKSYTRDSAPWLALDWRARGLWCLLQRVCDRRGYVDLGTAGKRALAVLLRADEASITGPLAELVEAGMVVEVERGLTLADFEAQQTARASDAARQRAKRERSQPVTRSHAASRDVTRGHDQNRIDHTRSDQREIARAREARVPSDPKAAELARDLQANPTFSTLDVASVAEALIGHLGAAAFNINADRWRPAIAEAALQVESGATEARKRQVLGWKFADLRDGKRRSTKRHAVQTDPDLEAQIQKWMDAPKPNIPAIDEF